MMPLASVLDFGTSLYLIKEQLYSKEVCTSESRIKVHKRIKKVESASNIRAHGGNILTQLVPLQRLTSMPIIPKRSGVHCAENVPPFEERPICMPKQP